MNDIIEIYDNYKSIGIKNRKITEGKEIELVKDYINFRKNQFIPTEENKLAIFLESKIDNAYPDIVFVEYNPNNYNNWNAIRDTLDKKEFKILFHIFARNGLNVSEIVSELGTSWKETILVVEKLNDSKLLHRNDSKWNLINPKILTTNKIEAVEAKINNWEHVLQQSIINRNFASDSYALSVSESNPNKNVLNKFKKFGVGVYIKNGDDFNTVGNSKTLETPVSFHSIFFNEWIGRILNAKEVI